MSTIEPQPLPVPAAATPQDSAVRRFLSWGAYPLALFAFSRAAAFTVTWLSLLFDPTLHRPGGPLPYPAIQGLCRWDCGWYEQIATQGYRNPVATNLFPLFPLLGRLLHELTGWPPNITLPLVANVAGLFATILIYRVFLEIEGEPTARAGLALWTAFPFSLFFYAGYTESLMALCTAWAMLCAARNQHIRAGILVGFGSLARHLTMIAGVALLYAQIKERGLNPKRFFLSKSLFGLVVPWLIFGLYPLYLGIALHDPLLFVKMHNQWGSAWDGIWRIFAGNFAPEVYVYVVASLIPAAGAALLLTKRRWRLLGAFGVSLMAVFWLIGLITIGRYSASVWPAFLPLAALTRRFRWAYTPLLVAFAMLQGMFLYLYTHSYPIN